MTPSWCARTSWRHVEKGEDHFEAGPQGHSEIGFAVLATSLSIVSVFIPVAFMGGIVGKFFFEFGIVIAFAVLVSLFVSFTARPDAGPSRWYDPAGEGGDADRLRRQAAQALQRRVRPHRQRYRGVIAWALDHRPLVLAIAVASFLARLAFPMPRHRRRPVHAQVRRGADPGGVRDAVGSSLDYTNSKGLELVRYLEARSEVKYTYLTIGGAAQKTRSTAARSSSR